MRVTLTLQQLKKLRALDEKEFKKIVELIRSDGIKQTEDYDEGYFRNLRGVNIVKMKAGKVWTVFAVNGTKPSPFVGHKKKRDATDPQKIAGTFIKKFQKAYSKSYGEIQALEWAHLSRIAKQFDVAEVEDMCDRFFSTTPYAKADITFFYNMRNRLHRETAGRRQEDIYGDKKRAGKSRGWAEGSLVD